MSGTLWGISVNLKSLKPQKLNTRDGRRMLFASNGKKFKDDFILWAF